jgi:hypothetical protein
MLDSFMIGAHYINVINIDVDDVGDGRHVFAADAQEWNR